MRSFLVEVVGGRRRSLPRPWLCLLFALAVALCAVFLVDRSAPAQEDDRQTYSAYDDPTKPVLSTVLSSDSDLAAFGKRFGLTDAEEERVLAVLREEDRVLGEEHDESDRLLKSNKKLPRDVLKQKVAASDYDERVRAAVSETKTVIEKLVDEGSTDELRAWVNERFAADAEEFYAQAVQPIGNKTVAGEPEAGKAATEGTTRATGYSCRVWATYYRGYTNYEVALPHKYLKAKGGVRVGVRNSRGDSVSGPVKEVGPWNIRDNYWVRPADRTQWKNLPRCVPEAAAAYYNNYNGGKDGFGREVLNPAGFDMTIAVARDLGVGRQIQRYGKVRVSVYFPWVRR
jgi:hypothetical protein